MLFFLRRKPRNPELLGHSWNSIRRSVGYHTDENQNSYGPFDNDHSHRENVDALRFPQVRSLPPQTSSRAIR
jgi:hypothetical protein